MIANKIMPLLQLALRYEGLLTETMKNSFIIDASQNLWEIIIQYVGRLEDVVSNYNIQSAYDLKGGFAQILINKDEIGNLSNAPNVTRLSLPSRMSFIDIGLGQVCAGNLAQSVNNTSTTGKNVLIAIIDSGIRYNHPDFITDAGESRILYLWDQTIGEDPWAENGGGGVVYTQAQINEALRAQTSEEQLAIVPSQDTLGHGTAVAGIAAGNGRGSAGNQNRGVAPDCELIIVKVGKRDPLHPSDIEIMHGIDFAIEKAIELKKPMSLLIGVGNNLTGHDGTAPLEIYMLNRYDNWILNFVVGMGNEGNQSAHASGLLETGQSQTIQISMNAPDMTEYGCCIWKRFSDEINLVLQSPTGEQTDELSLLTPNRAYLFDNVAVLINYSVPITSINQQVIYILFQAQGGGNLGSGLWTLTLLGNQIIEGDYKVWGAIVPTLPNNSIRFLSPSVENTLTTPATGYTITTVGAYNSRTRQVDAFSGRGFTADGRFAPDLVAPGVDIIAPSSQEDTLYTTITGTSAAAAFVAGAYAVLMSYGIYDLDNPNNYGELLRVYLLKTAQRPVSYAPYPNGSWGYGLMCIEAALLNMKEVEEQTT